MLGSSGRPGFKASGFFKELAVLKTASAIRAALGLGTAATTAATAYATAAQGGKADTAVQPIALGTAAALNSGTAIGNVPVLSAASTLPELSGINLTNVPPNGWTAENILTLFLENAIQNAVTGGAMRDGAHDAFLTDTWGATSTGEVWSTISGSHWYGPEVTSNGVTVNFAGDTVTGWDLSGDAATAVTFDGRSCVKLQTPTGNCNFSKDYGSFGALAVGNAYTLVFYADQLGTLASSDYLYHFIGGTNGQMLFAIATDGICPYVGSSYVKLAASPAITLDTWHTLTFRITDVASVPKADVFLDGVQIGVNTTVGAASGSSDGVIYTRLQRGGSTTNIVYLDSCQLGGRTVSALTLTSPTLSAATDPSDARLLLLFAAQSPDTVTLNTDLVAEISRDGGTSWSTVTLSDTGAYDSTWRKLAGVVDLSGQPSGISAKIRITNPNTKEFRVRGVAVTWN